MQDQKTRTVNLLQRLENLRRALGLTWAALADQMEISRIMLHYLKTGKKPLSVKLDYRLRQLENKAGVAPVVARGRQSYDLTDLDRCSDWMQTLKFRWKRSARAREDIRVALRMAFPKHVDEIIEWLGR